MSKVPYKVKKEAFVSGHVGGSVWEINAVTLVAPSAYLLWAALQSRHGFFEASNAAAYIADLLLNVCMILFATTIYATDVFLLNCLLIGTATAVYFLPSASSSQKSKKAALPKGESRDQHSSAVTPDPLPVKPFITAYRGGMMIVTCIAILAVDFKVFPRRFAKVENWGTSLMDMGVGSFVFAAGSMAARTTLLDRRRGKAASFASRLLASMRHCVPLLVLGVIRLYSVKGLDYAEHVTEYGVHWNFFFTLAFLPPLTTLFQSAFDMIPSYAILALMLSGVYEVLLDFTELKGYIIAAPRTNLISMNREGIFSFWGYLAIFLAGQGTGMIILPRDMEPATLPPKARMSAPKNGRLLARLGSWAGAWCLAYSISTSYYGFGLQVSRRLANFPYFVWVVAFNSCQLFLYCLVETLMFPGIFEASNEAIEKRRIKDATSRVLNAMNRNGLVLFLLANLTTGLVNLTLPTLDMSSTQAIGILIAHITVVSAVGLVLDRYNISIKL